jgi:hypothetical protein
LKNDGYEWQLKIFLPFVSLTLALFAITTNTEICGQNNRPALSFRH